MQKRSLLLLMVAAFLALGFPSSAPALGARRSSRAKARPRVDRWSKDGTSTVTFVAVGPGGIKMEGKTSELEVRNLRNVLTVVVPLTHLSTGIELRDNHMKEKYLETGKYPTAELKVRRADLKIRKGGVEVQSAIKATLRLHGQQKPVMVNYQAKPTPGGYEIVGSFRLNMTEYGIEVPEYLGVTVKPDVEITASFKVKG